MQLILLSGGSGKRLWPLSNDVRSKQFLPLLETPDGKMESMIQRVVRQIHETGLTLNITLAANVNQLDIISNQIGRMVDVVTEPERRDTFPAIALSACYLKHIKKCLNNEVIVVMPCDPYTELGYFDTIGHMVDCVANDVADLVLMGIAPIYPSEKYGYVVPQKRMHLGQDKLFEKVSYFTEKPTVEKAKELLSLGAFWNGGVFAFRLGYMLDIVDKYIQSEDFEYIRSNYVKFPKISFDYEVVEKAKSVAVVPFRGMWKDLGTWNTLTEELRKPVIGNAVIGTHCEDTHVINELHVPIYVEGVKNMVVAASSDGVLVCSKVHSEEIKKFVEKLTSCPMYEEKGWGTSRILDDMKCTDGSHSLIKHIMLKEGEYVNNQMYCSRFNVLTFIEGEGILVLDNKEKLVKAGDSIVILKGQFYTINAFTRLMYVEVQIGRTQIEGEENSTE